MTSVKKLLFDTLDELKEAELKRFKSFLKEDGPTPASVLENADRTEIVDQMLNRFDSERAVKITLDILKKMNQNHLAQQLENKLKKVKMISCAQTETVAQVETGQEKASRHGKSAVNDNLKMSRERQQLEVYVEGLQPQINAGLTKLDEIKKTRAALEQHKAEMDANKDFEYEIEVTVQKKIENNTKYYLTNCQTCHFTCHDRSDIADDREIYSSYPMKDGKCTVCPGKCVWDVHFNQKYKWVYVKEKRKETYHDFKKRYEDARGQVMSKEKIFEELERELQVVQEIVADLIKSSQKFLERLQEIALKPNPLSTPDYIDLMIESEKQEAKPGFKDRIQSLMDVREKAEIISKVPTGKVLPDDWNYKPETNTKKRII